MGVWDGWDTPESAPEKGDLAIVRRLEDPHACYSFDTFIVWVGTHKQLYWARDRGCSCPTPFADYRSLTDLHHLTTGTLDEFYAELKDHPSADVDKTELVALVSQML